MRPAWVASRIVCAHARIVAALDKTDSAERFEDADYYEHAELQNGFDGTTPLGCLTVVGVGTL